MVVATPADGDLSCTLALSPEAGAATLFTLVDKDRLMVEDPTSVADRECVLSFGFVKVTDRARFDTAVHHSNISSRE